MARPILSLTLEGLAETQETFGTLAPNEARNLARATVYGIAQVARDAIKETAPKLTGELGHDIKAVRRRGKPNYPVAEVQARGKDGDPYYWFFQEFGTRHQPAKPFVLPVVEQLRAHLVETYREQLGKKLEQQLARKARQAAKAGT